MNVAQARKAMTEDAAYLAMFAGEREHTALAAALLSSYLAAAQVVRDDLALQHAAEQSALQTIMRTRTPVPAIVYRWTEGGHFGWNFHQGLRVGDRHTYRLDGEIEVVAIVGGAE